MQKSIRDKNYVLEKITRGLSATEEIKYTIHSAILLFLSPDWFAQKMQKESYWQGREYHLHGTNSI